MVYDNLVDLEVLALCDKLINATYISVCCQIKTINNIQVNISLCTRVSEHDSNKK